METAAHDHGDKAQVEGGGRRRWHPRVPSEHLEEEGASWGLRRPRVFPELGCVGYPEQQQRRCEVVQYVEVFLDAGAVQREPIRRQEQLQEPTHDSHRVSKEASRCVGSLEVPFGHPQELENTHL